MDVEPGLRIAILIPFTAATGVIESAQEIAVHLAGAGHAVTVFSAIRHDPRPTRGLREVHMHARPFTAPLVHALFLVRAARGFDLVYAFFGSVTTGLWSLLSATPLWLNLDEEHRGRGWGRVGGRVALAAASAVVVDSASTLEALRACHRRLPRVHVIPPGAAVSHADPEPLVDYELAPACYYLVACPLTPESHVREIIEGFLAAHSAFPLVIVGDFGRDSSYETGLRTLAGARVRFMGAVGDRARMRALHCHARAYFHGHAQGGGRTLLQALGCGNLVIAYDNARNRELAGELARYFVTAADIPAAVAWAEDLDGPERRALAAAARTHIRDAHAWERVAALHLTALQELSAPAT